jgi:hypothetical protein
MSTQPAWCFLKIPTEDTPEIKKRFYDALEYSEIQVNASDFEREIRRKIKAINQEESVLSFKDEDKLNFRMRDFDQFVFEEMNKSYNFFFSEAFDNLLENIFDPYKTPLSVMPNETIIDVLTSDRIGASQMLYAGLGWEKANQLPGFFGNMLVESFEISDILSEVEMIFASVDHRKFLKKAKLAGATGNLNDYPAARLFDMLPAALKTSEIEECSLLTLNFSHAGCLPF